MRDFFTKKKNRTAGMLLSFFFLFFGLTMACLFRYGMSDCWYHSDTRDFSDSTQCYSYVYDALSYVLDNFSDTNPEDYPRLNSYGGKAFSFRIFENSSLLCDTTDESSDYVLSLSDDGGRIFEGYIENTVAPYDGCYTEYIVFSAFFPYRYHIMLGMLLFILLSLLLFMFSVTGVVEAGAGGRLSGLEGLPADGLMLLWAALYVGLWFLLRFIVSRILPYTDLSNGVSFVQLGWGVICQWLISSWVYLSVYYICGQIADKSLRSRSLCARLIRRVTFTGAIVFIGILHLLITLIVGVLYRSWSGSFILPAALVAADLLVIVLLLVFIRDGNTIRESIHTLAGGELHNKINIRHIHFFWKTIGQELNAIGDGMSLAVEERMRSERMKTELITNVSHDLKTPLTSIVNYVELLKNDSLTPEERTKYLGVLERQSNALKRLTEDVVEASKAASGALKVTFEILDACEFVKQVMGEYTERLENAKLEPVLVSPKEPVYILADGRHLWRVLDNVMTNVLKYALPGTRTYVELREEDEVHLTVKNISREPLNIPPERLMERFVRGDSSRRREGSGLGLSIARSLSELMNGHFDISLDGDLFRVDICFEKQDAPDTLFFDS